MKRTFTVQFYLNSAKLEEIFLDDRRVTKTKLACYISEQCFTRRDIYFFTVNSRSSFKFSHQKII